MNKRERNPIRPGEHLAEFLAEYEVSNYRLAKETGIAASRVGAIINNGRVITADTAMRLSKFFGTTAQFWMNLQANYDLQMAEMKHGSAYDKIESLAA